MRHAPAGAEEIIEESRVTPLEHFKKIMEPLIQPSPQSSGGYRIF
jgi:hypothetical protein